MIVLDKNLRVKSANQPFYKIFNINEEEREGMLLYDLENKYIILMDLQMPEKNGFEATEYIRKTMKSKVPIIALTANISTEDVSKCKEFGMNDYIAKPINEALLYSKIVELVRK